METILSIDETENFSDIFDSVSKSWQFHFKIKSKIWPPLTISIVVTLAHTAIAPHLGYSNSLVVPLIAVLPSCLISKW